MICRMWVRCFTGDVLRYTVLKRVSLQTDQRQATNNSVTRSLRLKQKSLDQSNKRGHRLWLRGFIVNRWSCRWPRDHGGRCSANKTRWLLLPTVFRLRRGTPASDRQYLVGSTRSYHQRCQSTSRLQVFSRSCKGQRLRFTTSSTTGVRPHAGNTIKLGLVSRQLTSRPSRKTKRAKWRNRGHSPKTVEKRLSRTLISHVSRCFWRPLETYFILLGAVT